MDVEAYIISTTEIWKAELLVSIETVISAFSVSHCGKN